MAMMAFRCFNTNDLSSFVTGFTKWRPRAGLESGFGNRLPPTKPLHRDNEVDSGDTPNGRKEGQVHRTLTRDRSAQARFELPAGPRCLYGMQTVR